MCADAVSIKRIVLYIKNPCSLCTPSLALCLFEAPCDVVGGGKEIKKKSAVKSKDE